MPYAPTVEATLIRRRVVGAGSLPDLYVIREYYFEPTRTAEPGYTAADFIEYESSDDTQFNLPSDVILGRYCVAPGASPFTEIRITHTGSLGGLVRTPFDGVTACMVVCTLGVTFTASPVSEGRVTLTATATLPQGDVVFSLDGFDTPGLPPNGPTGTTLRAWANQRLGTYTVNVLETRTGGCSATATITVEANYGPRYQLDFKDQDNTQCRLQIFEREYLGEVEVLPHGQREAVKLDFPGSGHVYSSLVKGSECALALKVYYDDQFRPLFSGDERLHRIDYQRDGSLFWRGFLLPEQYRVQFLAPPVEFSLSATDGLGTLSTLPFQGPAGQRLRGDWTMLQTILFCLGQLDVKLDLHVLLNLYPSTAVLNQPAILQIKTDVGQYVDSKGKPWDCGKVLRALITPFGIRVQQHRATWRLERLIELSPAPLTYQVYGPDGTRKADVVHSLLETIVTPSSGDAGPQWRTGGQSQELLGAISTVEVNSDPGDLVNLLRFALPKNTDLPGSVPVSWRTSNTPSTFAQLLYQGKDKTPLLRLVGTAGSYANSTLRESAALLAPWVQTPLTSPVPLPRGNGGPHSEESLVLRMKVKPYGVTPSGTIDGRSFFYIGLHFGQNWLESNVGARVERTDPVILHGTDLLDDKEFTFEVRGFASTQVGTQPVFVRLYTPVGGVSGATVDLSEIELEYDDFNPEIADFVGVYKSDTGNLVSRTDADTDLFHLDTPHARLEGTLLDAQSLPTLGWVEPDALGQIRDLGDYLVRDRVLWQRSPAQLLSGVLTQLPGPGVLLTDPQETHPGVYLLTDALHDAASATWQITATQLLPLTPTPEELPLGFIAYETGRAWLAENGRVLTYEYA